MYFMSGRIHFIFIDRMESDTGGSTGALYFFRRSGFYDWKRLPDLSAGAELADVSGDISTGTFSAGVEYRRKDYGTKPCKSVSDPVSYDRLSEAVCSADLFIYYSLARELHAILVFCSSAVTVFRADDIFLSPIVESQVETWSGSSRKEKEGGRSMIWEAMNKSLIIKNMKADSYEDVFRQLGGALINEGYVKSSYVNALCAREKAYPTGLDIDGFGVAIPHTDVSHVKQAATAIAVLKNPVTFIQMGSEDEEVSVKLVFMLAVAEPESYMEELQRILSIIQDKSVLNQIAEAEDEEKIIEIIREQV